MWGGKNAVGDRGYSKVVRLLAASHGLGKESRGTAKAPRVYVGEDDDGCKE